MKCSHTLRHILQYTINTKSTAKPPGCAAAVRNIDFLLCIPASRLSTYIIHVKPHPTSVLFTYYINTYTYPFEFLQMQLYMLCIQIFFAFMMMSYFYYPYAFTMMSYFIINPIVERFVI